MAYVPNPLDITKPTLAEELASAPEEFRKIKEKIVLHESAVATANAANAAVATFSAQLAAIQAALIGGDSSAELAALLAGETGANYIGFKLTATAVFQSLSTILRYREVSVKAFGAVGDGVADDTVAIQKAIDYLASIGGGVAYFPYGTYKVRKDNPTGSSGSNPSDYALIVRTSKITLRGETGAKILADNTAPSRFITLRIGFLPITNGAVTLSDIKVENLEFDGGYVYPGGVVVDDGYPIIWLHGTKRCTLRDLYIHNSSDYGIGIQNGGHQDFLLSNIIIEDTLADAIDVKNNGDADKNNRMDNITVRRFGRATDAVNPFAGIDVMGPGWTLTNIHVEDFGDVGTPNAGVRFKQGSVGETHGDGGHYSVLTNFYIKAKNVGYALQAGVKVSAQSVKVGHGTIIDCVAEGLLIEQQECSASDVTVLGCGDGVRLRNSAYTSNGDRTTLTAITARNNTRGFVFETLECTATGCVSRSNDTNVVFLAGGGQNRWIGGEIANHLVKAVTNAGSNNVIRDAIGFATEAEVESATFDITVAGEKTVNIPHGFAFTPDRKRCQISVLRSGNNVPWSVSRLMVVDTDATNVVCKIFISVASGTVGDTATLALLANSRYIPAIA